MLTLGASRIAFGNDNAHCMPQIESGLIYISERKCPSIVHASGVWNEYLTKASEKRRHQMQIFHTGVYPNPRDRKDTYNQTMDFSP